MIHPSAIGINEPGQAPSERPVFRTERADQKLLASARIGANSHPFK
jgi:hypothetical protein